MNRNRHNKILWEYFVLFIWIWCNGMVETLIKNVFWRNVILLYEALAMLIMLYPMVIRYCLGIYIEAYPELYNMILKLLVAFFLTGILINLHVNKSHVKTKRKEPI